MPALPVFLLEGREECLEVIAGIERGEDRRGLLVSGVMVYFAYTFGQCVKDIGIGPNLESALV